MRAGVAHLVGTFTFFKKIWRRRYSFAVADPYPGYLVYDSFTRADSTTSPGSATEKGGAWVTLGTSAWGVIGGKLYATDGVPGDLVVLGNTPSGSVLVDVIVGTSSSGVGPVFRLADASNFLLAQIQGPNGTSGNFVLYSCLSGSFVALQNNSDANTHASVAGVTYPISAAFNGVQVILSFNGVTYDVVTLSGGAAALAGTLCGMRHVQVGDRADNYRVSAA